MALSTGDTGFVLEILEAAGDLFFNSRRDRHKAIPFYRVPSCPIASGRRCGCPVDLCALPSQDRALPISGRSGGGGGARLRLCNKLTQLMLSLKSYEEAVEFARTALDISVSQGKGRPRFQTAGFGGGSVACLLLPPGEQLKERVAYHRLAALYRRLDQHELAEHYYLKALALCPAPLLFEEETLYYLGVYQTLGDITFYHLKVNFTSALSPAICRVGSGLVGG